MPLDRAALLDGMPGASGTYPLTHREAALAWSTAVSAWASGIVPPSTTVVAATSALEVELAAVFVSQVDAALALEGVFARFALAVGLGMAGYVPTPPPGLVGFVAMFLEPRPSSRREGVERLAGRLDAWMRTGSATLVAPPGTVVPWQ
jgi:hypothetical protein